MMLLNRERADELLRSGWSVEDSYRVTRSGLERLYTMPRTLIEL
jgi:hypothetical protein